MGSEDGDEKASRGSQGNDDQKQQQYLYQYTPHQQQTGKLSWWYPLPLPPGPGTGGVLPDIKQEIDWLSFLTANIVSHSRVIDMKICKLASSSAIVQQISWIGAQVQPSCHVVSGLRRNPTLSGRITSTQALGYFDLESCTIDSIATWRSSKPTRTSIYWQKQLLWMTISMALIPRSFTFGKQRIPLALYRKWGWDEKDIPCAASWR